MLPDVPGPPERPNLPGGWEGFTRNGPWGREDARLVPVFDCGTGSALYIV